MSSHHSLSRLLVIASSAIVIAVGFANLSAQIPPLPPRACWEAWKTLQLSAIETCGGAFHKIEFVCTPEGRIVGWAVECTE